MNTVPHLENTSGKLVRQKGTDEGAAHVTDQNLKILQGLEDGSGNPKTALSDVDPVTYLNVPVAATPGAPLSTEVTEIDLTLANHSGKTVTATGFVLSCSGDAAFQGIHVAWNYSSKVAVVGASGGLVADPTPPNSATVGDHRTSNTIVPKGATLYLPVNQTMGLLHLIAIGSAVNCVSVTPV